MKKGVVIYTDSGGGYAVMTAIDLREIAKGLDAVNVRKEKQRNIRVFIDGCIEEFELEDIT